MGAPSPRGLAQNKCYRDAYNLNLDQSMIYSYSLRAFNSHVPKMSASACTSQVGTEQVIKNQPGSARDISLALCPTTTDAGRSQRPAHSASPRPAGASNNACGEARHKAGRGGRPRGHLARCSGDSSHPPQICNWKCNLPAPPLPLCDHPGR